MRDKIDTLKPKQIGNLYEKQGQAGWIYSIEHVAPIVPGFGAGGGGKETKILVERKDK